MSLTRETFEALERLAEKHPELHGYFSYAGVDLDHVVSVFDSAARIKQSSSELSTKAARLMSMDDDEMRKVAIPPEHQSISDGQNYNTMVEVRLTPQFCDLVRSIAAGIVSQDQTKGQG